MYKTLFPAFLLSVANPAFLLAQVDAGGAAETLHFQTGNDLFGTSIAGLGDMDGDGLPDYAVGSPTENLPGKVDAGVVRVFSGADGSLLFRFDGASAGDNLGRKVADAGDVDNDGHPDILASAPFATVGGDQRRGYVVVFSGLDGSVLHRLDGPPGSNDSFGRGIAGAGDLNGDGHAEILVTARDVLYANTSTLHVFSGQDASQLFFMENRYAGTAVANAGDVNADGTPDFIVGTPYYGHGHAFGAAGGATVISGADFTSLYRFRGRTQLGEMGHVVAGPGDLDGDGHDDLLVGSNRADFDGLHWAGRVVAYSGATGERLYMVRGEVGSEQLGTSLSGAGDVDGDGHVDFLIGASQADQPNHPEAGFVSLHSGLTGARLHRFEGQAHEQHLGSAVSALGDLDGDGKDEFLVSGSGGILGPQGRVGVMGFEPFLTTDTASVSAAAGGTLGLTIDFPASEAGLDYQVLMSTASTEPTMWGVRIPLNPTSLLEQTALGNYPIATHAGLTGVLDVTGNASASFTIPAGAYTHLAGTTLWYAAVVRQSGSAPSLSSIAIPVQLAP